MIRFSLAVFLAFAAMFSTQAMAGDKKVAMCRIAALIAERNFSIGVLNKDESDSERKGFFTAIGLLASSDGLTDDQIKAVDAFVHTYFTTNASGFMELADSRDKLELSIEQTSEIFATIVVGECLHNQNSPAKGL